MTPRCSKRRRRLLTHLPPRDTRLIGLTYIAQLGMGTEWRIGIDRDEDTGLVTFGMFAVVRNRIFTAMILTAVGFAAMAPNLIAIAAAGCLVVAIQLQVRFVEEPHLQQLHGSAYRNYAARVGRFVPAVGESVAPARP